MYSNGSNKIVPHNILHSTILNCTFPRFLNNPNENKRLRFPSIKKIKSTLDNFNIMEDLYTQNRVLIDNLKHCKNI